MAQTITPVWVPTFEYKAYDAKSNMSIPRSVVLEEHNVNECPVSFITPQSAELVKKYFQARRQGKTLSKLLGMNDAFMEDVEEVFYECKETVKTELDKDRDRNRG